MLKITIIDDEQLALDRLERILKESNKVELVGKYSNGKKALKGMEEFRPDIVFLDINLPDISGVDLAKKIIKKNEECWLVFVTAFEEYAIKAFELGVSDYILKPYKSARLHEIIDKYSSLKSESNSKRNCMIHNFKYFHFTKNGREIKKIKWRTAKSRELFVYLLHNNKKFVRKDILIDMLWPEIELEKAYDNLYTSVYQVRKILVDNEIDVEIKRTVNGYELDLKNITYDVDEWLDLVNRIEDLLINEGNLKKIISLYKKAFKLYKGHYLDEESYLWKENLKEQYRIMFLTLSKQVVQFLLDNEKSAEASIMTLQIQDIYPYIEYSYFILMQLYNQLGDRYGVIQQYEALNEMLENEFEMQTSMEIQEWFQNWMHTKQVN